jgi:hypothetical protein
LRDSLARQSWWLEVDRRLVKLRRAWKHRLVTGGLRAVCDARPWHAHDLDRSIDELGVDELDLIERRWEAQVDLITIQLEARIRRPRPGATAAARREAQAARSEAQARIDDEAATIAARMTTAPCWTVLGCAPGSGYPTLKASLAARKEELRMTGGTMDQFRLLDEALVEALERLRTGVW